MQDSRTDTLMLDLSSSPRLTRRALLRAAAFGASLAGGAALLAACGGSSATATVAPAGTATAPAGTATATRAAAPSSGASAPASAAASAPASAAGSPAGGGATPGVAAATPSSAPTRPATPGTPATSGKIPSPGLNVPDAYVTPPASYRSVSAIPGKGTKISIVKASQQPPAVARENNSWWLELEKRIGATLDITLIPLPQYTEKATLLIAGGQIPDILLISPLSVPDQYRAVQDGAFADVTSALSTEALKAYPNLSLYPASAWKNSLVRGKAYGVPRLGLAIGPALLYRQDWAEKLGVPQPRNADDFLRLVTAMSKNDPDGNGKPDTWGLGSQGGDWSMSFIQGMHRVPNGWRKNADGTLTNAIETDEYRQAITFARRCFEAGAYYPDAVTLNRTQATNALIAGQIGGYADQLVQLNGDIRTRFEAKKINPNANVAALVPPGFDGGQAYTYNGTGFGSTAAFPATAAKQQGRVEELLRVLDYYSAPFGSDEYNFLTFGIEGVHHILQPDGTRILNDRGRAEISELGTVVLPPRVFYFPSDPGDAAYLQQAAYQIAQKGIDNPALTAFSPTNVAKTAELNQLATDRVGGMITGRDPLTALDTYIADWRSRGGDQIRKELQDAIAGS